MHSILNDLRARCRAVKGHSTMSHCFANGSDVSKFYTQMDMAFGLHADYPPNYRGTVFEVEEDDE